MTTATKTIRPTVSAEGPGRVVPGASGTVLDLYDLTLTYTNPSECREMTADFLLGLSTVEMTQSPGSDWTVRWGYTSTTDGSIPAVVEEFNGGVLVQNRHSANADFGTNTHFPPVFSDLPLELITGQPVIAPDGEVKVRVRVQVQYTTTNPATIPGDLPPMFGNANLILTGHGWT